MASQTQPVAGGESANGGGAAAFLHARAAARAEVHPVEAPPSASARDIANGLEAALRLRSPDLHASTPLVRKLAVAVCRELGLPRHERELVDLCAQLRDVGMLGLPDHIVRCTTALSPEQWEVVNRHPVIGADLLAAFPGLATAAPVVRSHHERWDGEGYPDALAGTAIAQLSRVIAAADTFVALANDRPHRRGLPTDVALEHLAAQRGSQLEPAVVDVLLELIQGGGRLSGRMPDADPAGAVRTRRAATPPGQAAAPNLKEALASLDVLPAFAVAHDRAVTFARQRRDRDLVTTVEADLGLTVAVLRRAQDVAERRVHGVPDAVHRLGTAGVLTVLGELEQIPFPWRTDQDALIHELRVHGQIVARAVDRIARETSAKDSDELITAALLHDTGKLVLQRLRPADGSRATAATQTPEARLLAEHRRFTVDHASLSGILMGQWGMPRRLREIVTAHHTADERSEAATILRLADMVAHHAVGDAVNRRIMLDLANAAGLGASSLRDVLFDLPQSGSQRRRAEPSPLSTRETDVLRQLSTGKVYKQISHALCVSPSTVRTHLHNIYAKLGVDDRAQAVLLATEMGWI